MKSYRHVVLTGLVLLVGCSGSSTSDSTQHPSPIGIWIDSDKALGKGEEVKVLELRDDGIYVLRIFKRADVGKDTYPYEFAKGQWQLVSRKGNELTIKVPDIFHPSGPMQYFKETGKIDLSKAGTGMVRFSIITNSAYEDEEVEMLLGFDESNASFQFPGDVWYIADLSEGGSLAQRSVPEMYFMSGTYLRIDSKRIRELVGTISVNDDMKPHELRYLKSGRSDPESPLTRLGFPGTHTP